MLNEGQVVLSRQIYSGFAVGQEEKQRSLQPVKPLAAPSRQLTWDEQLELAGCPNT